MPSSAIWPVDVALEQAAMAHQPLVDLLAGDTAWYAGKPPQGTPYPFISNEDTQERELPIFQGDHQDGSRILHIWSDGSKRDVGLIYMELYRLLHRQPITVEGFGHLLGTLRFISYVPDPETGLHHGVAEYRVVTRKEAEA